MILEWWLSTSPINLIYFQTVGNQVRHGIIFQGQSAASLDKNVLLIRDCVLVWMNANVLKALPERFGIRQE